MAETTDWKNHHANEANLAAEHPLVRGVIEEYADNMGFDPHNGLPAYGAAKIARYAAQVARAQALGFDPELLRMTDAEANSEQLRFAAEATVRGIPVYMLDGRESHDSQTTEGDTHVQH